jgi:hypothetical protein
VVRIAPLVGSAVIALGCSPEDTEWRPKHPDQEYAQVVKVASRVKHASDACQSTDRVTLGYRCPTTED